MTVVAAPRTRSGAYVRPGLIVLQSFDGYEHGPERFVRFLAHELDHDQGLGVVEVV